MRQGMSLAALTLAFTFRAAAATAAPLGPFPGGVTALPDIVYAQPPGTRPLSLDLYRPAASGPHPLVVYIHGGGWSGGNSRMTNAAIALPTMLAALAGRGYAVASINYRLSGEARFPAQLEDVRAAITFLRAQASQYGIDPARSLVWGASSGGHLAALAAERCDCAQGAVIWYGVFDLEGSGDPQAQALLGCDPKSCADQAKAASPLAQVTAKVAPMLLIHGLSDTDAPADQARAMAAKLRRTGVPVQTLFIPDAGHGFAGPTPEASKAATDQALARTFAYIDTVFARKN